MIRLHRNLQPRLIARCCRCVSSALSTAAVLGLGLDAFCGAAPGSAPLSPKDEAATFEWADALLTADLVAAEPEVVSPVAMCWDANGRLFVAEMIDYPVVERARRLLLQAGVPARTA